MKSSARPFALLRTALYMSAFVALWAWLAALSRGFDPVLGGALPRALGPPGVVLMIAGGAVVVACGLVFALRGEGTPAPFDAPRRFVASGPYRWVRNPMYLGALLVLVGAGLLVGSPGILALAVLAAGLAHALVVLVEEPALTARFGESYRQYRRTVNRWLPVGPANGVDRTVGTANRLLGWLGTVLLLAIIPIKLLRFEPHAARSFAIGVAPSLLGPAGFVFLLLSGTGRLARLSLLQVALIVGAISVALEFAQMLPRPGALAHIHYTFDEADLGATVVSVALAYAVAAWILGRPRPPGDGAG
jgi:protein-S-isoprenylcysteine O-methyltransferase Ste14